MTTATTLTTSENERREKGMGGDRRKTYGGDGTWGGETDVADEYRVNHLSHVELDGWNGSLLSKGPTSTVVVVDSF